MIILWIVIAVIAAGMFSEWIGLKKEQAKLGAGFADSDARLDALRAELEAEQARLRQRIEHLEAIVTDEDWDAERPRADRLDPDPLAPPDEPTEAVRPAPRVRG